MKRIRVIWMIVLTVVLAAGCHRVPPPEEEPGTLTVRIYIPESAITKAETGLEDPLTDERVMTSLQIWVFRAGATEASGLIGYRLLDGDALAATGLTVGHETRFTIPVTKQFAEEIPKPTVDIYAVVNGASAGFKIENYAYASGDWSKVNPSDLLAFTVSGDYFGTTTLTKSVPAAGLPMAGLTTSQPVTGDFPVLSVATLTVTRTVSKLRFVFCQLTDNGVPVDKFNITKINLNGLIGKQEKLFTEQTYTGHTYGTKLFDIGTAGYDALAKIFPTDGDLPAMLAYNAAPGDYLYQPGMTAQEYENLIQSGISSGVLTPWGLTYLRETDKKLTGEIYYTVGEGATMRSKIANFTLDAEGDFTRNHSWTIYGYFIGGRLVVQPTILPWIAAHERLVYTTEGNIELGYERPWLRYDIDMQAWTWGDTWLVVAYGYEGGSVGKPTRSTKFTLETLSSNDLRLQLNNDQFILVKETQSEDAEHNTTYAYTKLSQTLTIPASSEKQTTNFYVVPVNDGVMADPYVKVFLTELHSGDGLPPTNIPFNHNLPGDEDHASILIYNPGSAEYDANKNNPKTTPNVQTTQYWLEEAD
ncbi:MAG: hypothetical protein J6X89_05750 [Bacteroidales bacterium]|nr:hypothetical protein [Bacteroidales bacterium]